MRLPLPGLEDVQATLQQEQEQEQEVHVAEPEEAPPADPPPAFEMPSLPPLESSPAPSPPRTDLEEPTHASTSGVRLGENKPYPKYLSLRDWIRDFFGGLFGN